MPAAIAVVGHSNSGKTWVASGLIRLLSAAGYSVAAVKHCHEGHQLDIPGKDTDRLFQAGAGGIIASSPGQITSIRRTEGDAALEDLIPMLGPGYDLVVAEGFKASAVPKVLVVDDQPIPVWPTNVVAVVGGTSPLDVPHYGFPELSALARQLQGRLLGA